MTQKFGPVSTLYVDNVILGLYNDTKASGIVPKLKALFKDTGMNLRELNSNNQETLRDVAGEDLAKSTTLEVLGLRWLMDSDEYEIDMLPYRATKFTQRALLAHVSSTFDPLGLLEPAVIQANRFRHKVWQNTEEV